MQGGSNGPNEEEVKMEGLMPEIDLRYAEPVQADKNDDDSESQRLIEFPKSDSSEEGAQSDDENDLEPVVAQVENQPQNQNFAPQQAIVIDRRQREIENNAVPILIEERKD